MRAGVDIGCWTPARDLSELGAVKRCGAPHAFRAFGISPGESRDACDIAAAEAGSAFSEIGCHHSAVSHCLPYLRCKDSLGAPVASPKVERFTDHVGDRPLTDCTF